MRDPASSVARIAAAARRGSSSVIAASASAAWVTVVGGRLTSLPDSGSSVTPKVSSIHEARGSWVSASYPESSTGSLASAGPRALTAVRSWCESGVRFVVALTNVSVTTWSERTSVPKIRLATSATSSCCSATVPPLDIVADVPMHWSVS